MVTNTTAELTEGIASIKNLEAIAIANNTTIEAIEEMGK